MNLLQKVRSFAARTKATGSTTETAHRAVNVQRESVTHSEPHLRTIDSFEELDAMFHEVEAAFALSSIEGMRKLNQFQFAYTSDVPADPYSQEYHDHQMQLYSHLSGRASYHSYTNEQAPFDLEQAKRAPYPYFTYDAATVGNQLVAIGFLIKTMNLPPHARIVEFGPGWGNTTLQLAHMGYDVTAVEIEPNFCTLIAHRAERIGVNIHIVNCDMVEFQSEAQYDVALFFESFHHCANHLQLLRNLYECVTPDGMIVFAAEPITSFPHPWGFVRLEGLTIWSIRRYGWFELGFDTSYFLRTLLLFGWLPKRHSGNMGMLTEIITARKSQGLYRPHELELPPDEAASWSHAETKHRFTTASSIMSCSQRNAVHMVEFCVSNPAPLPLRTTFIAGTTRLDVTVPMFVDAYRVQVACENWMGKIEIAGETWNPGSVLQTTDDREIGVAVHWFQLH